MHAYLITGGNKKARSEKIDTLVASSKGTLFDLRILSIPEDQQSITVELIRDWTRSLSFTNTKKNPLFGIIMDAERMTAEGQAALLKTLEEPPGEVKILIETENGDTLLPTIRSRTTHIFLGNSASGPNEDCPTTVGSIISKVQEKGKTKADGKEYLTSVMTGIHGSWKSCPDAISAKKLRKCLMAMRMLSVNVSPYLAIEWALFP